MMSNYLFPFTFKWIGGGLVFSGLVGLINYLFFDFRLMMPVFAICSSFFEIRTFCIVQTNIADEIILLLFLTGFLFLTFSREKNESETLDLLRAKAMIRAFVSNTLILCLATLFFFGNGFLVFLFINLFSIQVLFLAFFHIILLQAIVLPVLLLVKE